jgi:hypothetical protein
VKIILASNSPRRKEILSALNIDFDVIPSKVEETLALNNGVYKFVDRHSEAVDKSDDASLFERHSYNFSIAAYDLDTNILYYFEFDT